MTRRKRTPPPIPAPTVAARYNIPASLQQLSALSASLARSASTPVEQANSEIVRAAQERAKVAGGGTGGGMGREKKSRGKKTTMLQTKEKPLRWKTTEHVFPDEQTWIKPQGRNRSAQGHATFMGRRFLVGRTDGKGGGEDRGDGAGAVVTPLPQGWPDGQLGGGVGTVGGAAARVVGGADVHGGAPQQQRRPANGPTLQVRMDHRVKEARVVPSSASLPSSAPGAAPAAMGNGSVQAPHPPPFVATTTSATAPPHDEAELEANQAGARKRRHVEFVERHQRDFPSGQTWMLSQAKTPSRKAPVAKFSSEIEARRAAIIAQLRQTHSPVAIVGVDDVEGAPGQRMSGDGRGGGGGLVVMPPPLGPPPQRMSNSVPFTPPSAAAEGGDGGDGAAGGQGVAGDQQAQITALIAQKRAENAANGQVLRLLGLKSEHQRKMAEKGEGGRLNAGWGPYPPLRPVSLVRAGGGGGGMGTGMAQQGGWGFVPGGIGVGNGVRMGGPRSALGPAAAAAAVAPQGVIPLQGLAEAARAVMEAPRLQVLDGIAAAAAQEVDSDEDAPGEDDTPDVGLVAPPAGPDVEADETVLQSVEGLSSASQSAGAGVPSRLNRLVDPGDLRSLFSSPGPSSRAQSAPAVEMGRKGGGGGYAEREAVEMHHDDNDNDEDEHETGEGEESGDAEGPPSPSAQLLMALANATPPPTSVSRQQVGAREDGVGAADGRHRRTRSGLVIAAS